MEGSRGEWMGVEESGGEERGGDDRRVEGSKGEWKGVEEGGKATHVRHVHIVNNAALRAADFDLSILAFYSYTL